MILGLILRAVKGAPLTMAEHDGNLTALEDAIGDIVESGSNANGSYVRLADGTLICWHRVTVSQAISTSFMGGFRSSPQTWTYPAAFAASPEVCVTALAQTAFGASMNNTPGTASVGWVVTAVTSQSAADRIVSLVAIGPSSSGS